MPISLCGSWSECHLHRPRLHLLSPGHFLTLEMLSLDFPGNHSIWGKNFPSSAFFVGQEKTGGLWKKREKISGGHWRGWWWSGFVHKMVQVPKMNAISGDDDVMMLMLDMVVVMRKRRELAVAWLLEEKSWWGGQAITYTATSEHSHHCDHGHCGDGDDTCWIETDTVFLSTYSIPWLPNLEIQNRSQRYRW